MSPVQICSVAFFFTALLIILLQGIQRRSRGPTVWPILGFLPYLPFHFERIHDWLTDLVILNGGTVRLHGPWKSKILTADSANIECIVRTRYHNFGKGEKLKDIFRDVLGDALLAADGERFAQLNKSVGMALNSAAFRNRAAAALPAAVHEKLLPLLGEACVKGAVIDLQDVFRRLAFDNVCAVGFGIDPASLSSGVRSVPLLKAYEEAIGASMIRMLLPTFCWKTMRYFNFGPERRLRRASEIMDACVDDLMARWAAQDCGNIGRPRSDVLSNCLRFERESGRDWADNTVRSLFIGIFAAGMDTISSGLTWFFWLVAQHPRVEAKILAEIRRIIKQRPVADSCNEYDPCPLRLEEVKQMHYLHAALSESLRLYPPTPIESTEAAEDDVLPDGTVVEKGSQMLYSIYACGRMDKVWGADCREFKPERWLKNERFVRESDFKFVVFNGGSRRCTGREFAYLQMKLVAASVITRYRLRTVDNHPRVPKFTLTLPMKDGLLVTIHSRLEEEKNSAANNE